MTTKMKKAKALEAALTLKYHWLKPGDTIYTDVRHVSRSGMGRSIRVFKMDGDTPFDITGWVSEAIGWRMHKTGGVWVEGAGMDMGFHTVYTLAQVLFKDGYSLKQKWL